jgi:hypothetical protein
MIYMKVKSLEVVVIVTKKYTLLFLFLLEEPLHKFDSKLILQIKGLMYEIWQFVKDQMVLALDL